MSGGKRGVKGGEKAVRGGEKGVRGVERGLRGVRGVCLVCFVHHCLKAEGNMCFVFTSPAWVCMLSLLSPRYGWFF